MLLTHKVGLCRLRQLQHVCEPRLTFKSCTLVPDAVMSVAVQLAGLGELQGQSQRYNVQLQEYNGRLQNEVRGLKDAVAALQAAKDTATEATAALRGQLTAAEAQITTAKVRLTRRYSQSC